MFVAISGAPKRRHILNKLTRYIPKQFTTYYVDKVVAHNKPEAAPSAPTFSMEDAMQNALVRRQNKERTLRRENNLSRPIDRHKRKKKAITRKHGFDGLCKGLMSEELYLRYEECMKEWKGLDRNDINFGSNKKAVLQKMLNILKPV